MNACNAYNDPDPLPSLREDLFCVYQDGGNSPIWVQIGHDATDGGIQIEAWRYEDETTVRDIWEMNDATASHVVAEAEAEFELNKP